MNALFRGVLCTALASGGFLLPSAAHSQDCPTDSLASVIALGSCALGDTTITFGPPSLPALPLWNPGPFAGNTMLGPSASAVTFTPLPSATDPGFRLSGTFSATGGNTWDVSFGYFYITAPEGFDIGGRTLSMGGANVSTDNTFNRVTAAISQDAVAFLNATGEFQLSGSEDFSPFSIHSLPHILSLKAYNFATGNPSSISAFSDITYTTSLVALIPEPETYAMLVAGLGLLGFLARRRRATSGLRLG